jgi:hypothetical protein
MNANFLRGPGNISLDLARIIGASAGVLYPFPFIFNVFAHGVVPDPASFGTGYAVVLGAIGVMIGAKDIAVAKAIATNPGGGA